MAYFRLGRLARDALSGGNELRHVVSFSIEHLVLLAWFFLAIFDLQPNCICMKNGRPYLLKIRPAG
jgi:hypothetical protein